MKRRQLFLVGLCLLIGSVLAIPPSPEVECQLDPSTGDSCIGPNNATLAPGLHAGCATNISGQISLCLPIASYLNASLISACQCVTYCPDLSCDDDNDCTVDSQIWIAANQTCGCDHDYVVGPGCPAPTPEPVTEIPPPQCNVSNSCVQDSLVPSGLPYCHPIWNNSSSWSNINSGCDDCLPNTVDMCLFCDHGHNGTFFCKCEHIPMPGACNTSSDCISEDPCQVGVCPPDTGICTYVPKDCNDGDACTIDACIAGTCVHSEISCDYGDACVTGSCDSTIGCVFENITIPDSPVACAQYQCDSVSGLSLVPILNFCGGNFSENTTGSCVDDYCDIYNMTGFANATGCVRTASTCNDGYSCTTDFCLFGSGCYNVPHDSACTGGSECTIASCAATGDTAPSGCTYTPDDSACNADIWNCQYQYCDAVLGCQIVNDDSYCVANSPAYGCATAVCNPSGNNTDANGCTYVTSDSYCSASGYSQDGATTCQDTVCNPWDTEEASGCVYTLDDSNCASYEVGCLVSYCTASVQDGTDNTGCTLDTSDIGGYCHNQTAANCLGYDESPICNIDGTCTYNTEDGPDYFCANFDGLANCQTAYCQPSNGAADGNGCVVQNTDPNQYCTTNSLYGSLPTCWDQWACSPGFGGNDTWTEADSNGCAYFQDNSYCTSLIPDIADCLSVGFCLPMSNNTGTNGTTGLYGDTGCIFAVNHDYCSDGLSCSTDFCMPDFFYEEGGGNVLTEEFWSYFMDSNTIGFSYDYSWGAPNTTGCFHFYQQYECPNSGSSCESNICGVANFSSLSLDYFSPRYEISGADITDYIYNSDPTTGMVGLWSWNSTTGCFVTNGTLLDSYMSETLNVWDNSCDVLLDEVAGCVSCYCPFNVTNVTVGNVTIQEHLYNPNDTAVFLYPEDSCAGYGGSSGSTCYQPYCTDGGCQLDYSNAGACDDGITCTHDACDPTDSIVASCSEFFNFYPGACDPDVNGCYHIPQQTPTCGVAPTGDTCATSTYCFGSSSDAFMYFGGGTFDWNNETGCGFEDEGPGNCNLSGSTWNINGGCVEISCGADTNGTCNYVFHDSYCDAYSSYVCVSAICSPYDLSADSSGCIYTFHDDSCTSPYSCMSGVCNPDASNDVLNPLSGCQWTDLGICPGGNDKKRSPASGCIDAGACYAGGQFNQGLFEDYSNGSLTHVIVYQDTGCFEVYNDGACQYNPGNPSACDSASFCIQGGDNDGHCSYSYNNAACIDSYYCTNDQCTPAADGADPNGCVHTAQDSMCTSPYSCVQGYCLQGYGQSTPNGDYTFVSPGLGETTAAGCTFYAYDNTCNDVNPYGYDCTYSACVANWNFTVGDDLYGPILSIDPGFTLLPLSQADPFGYQIFNASTGCLILFDDNSCTGTNQCLDAQCQQLEGSLSCVYTEDSGNCDAFDTICSNYYCSGDGYCTEEATCVYDGDPCHTNFRCDLDNGCQYDQVPNCTYCSTAADCTNLTNSPYGLCTAPGTTCVANECQWEPKSCPTVDPCNPNSCSAETGLCGTAPYCSQNSSYTCAQIVCVPLGDSASCQLSDASYCSEGISSCATAFCNPSEGIFDIAVDNVTGCAYNLDQSECEPNQCQSSGICTLNDGCEYTDYTQDELNILCGSRSSCENYICDPEGTACLLNIGDGAGCCTEDSDCDAYAPGPCQVSHCNTYTATCYYTGLDDQSSCTPSDACITNGTCNGGVCSGAPVDCDDGNPCTVDCCIPWYPGGYYCEHTVDHSSDGRRLHEVYGYVPDQCVNNTQPANCHWDDECWPFGRCEGQQYSTCAAHPNITCGTDHDCFFGDHCRPGAFAGLCVDYCNDSSVEPTGGAPCTIDANCTRGYVCVYSQCVPYNGNGGDFASIAPTPLPEPEPEPEPESEASNSTSAASSSSSAAAGSSSSSGLSPGAIVGITLGALAAAILCFIGLTLIVYADKKRRMEKEKSGVSTKSLGSRNTGNGATGASVLKGSKLAQRHSGKTADDM